MIDVSPLVPEAREIVRRVAQIYFDCTRPWFIGLLIHGSALKGGFIPGCSDIDFRLYLRDDAFESNGDLRFDLSLAIQRALSPIDPAPFQYIQCYAQPPRLTTAPNTGGDIGPFPGTYHILRGELPVPEPTADQIRARARHSLATLQPIPAHLANGLLDHGGGRLERHVRLLCTEVWPTLFNVLTLRAENPADVWKRSKVAAIELLPADEALGKEIRAFHRAVLEYYTRASSVENALAVFERGVAFLQAARALWEERRMTTTPSTHPLRARDYFALNAYWFALSFLWNSMAPLLLPALVLRVVDEAHKGAAVGALGIVGLIIATIVQPAAGAWTDTRTTRWGKRRPYIIGGTLFDVVFLLVVFVAGDYFVLLIAYALLQIVSNLAHGPYQAYLTDLVPEARRGKVSGVKLIFEMVGGIATALAVGNLIGQGQMFAAFFAIIFFLLITMLITARFVDERPFDGLIVAAPPRAKPKESLLQLLFHSRDFFLWLVSRLAILTAVNLIRDYLMFFLKDVLRMENPAAGAGNLLALFGVSVALIVYPAGALSDRWGRKPLVVFSGALGAVGALALLFATTMPMVLIAGTIVGIGIGIFLSVNWAWGADLIPSNAGGRLLGVSNLATAGAGVFAGAGGWMLDFFNAQSPNLGYTALYLTAALCYVVGTLIVLGVRETKTDRGLSNGAER